MSEFRTGTIYFGQPGKENRQRVLELVGMRSQETGVKTIVAASSTGETGAAAVEMLQGCRVIVVSHTAGFIHPNEQELQPEYCERITKGGGVIVTAAHAFGGVNRAVRKKFDTYQLDEIIAHTLRIFGEGLKVTVEIALMAADAGQIRVGEPVIVMAGTGKGTDTAVMLIPAYSHSFFDLKILEVICMPAAKHPQFLQS